MIKRIKNKRTNNDLQNIAQKTKDRVNGVIIPLATLILVIALNMLTGVKKLIVRIILISVILS